MLDKLSLIHSIPVPKRIAFIACICAATFGIVIDILFFDLKTIQGHLYIVFLEIILQLVIYSIATSNNESNSASLSRKGLVVVLLLNAIAIGYKAVFISFLTDVRYIEDFSDILPFASGPAYGLRPVADGHIDIIANALYQRGLWMPRSAIDLAEPGIVYFFVGVSMIAGEFNQHVLWLSLHVVNFLTAVVLLKATREIFPAIRFPWFLPVLYILLSDVHGANHLLFKDGLLTFALVSIFYLNVRYIFQKNLGRMPFELLSVLLIVSLYELRSGMLAMITVTSILNCMFDRKNRLQHARIFLIAVFISGMLASNNGIPYNLMKAVNHTYEKIMVGSSSHLDMNAMSYTVSEKDSLLVKFNLHQITPTNFFYAPFAKASLYFLLPLPVTEFISTTDSLYKANSCTYFTLFLLLLIGIYKIISQGKREEWYLLAIFGLCMASILGAGPMIYPRYRIMASVFFLLVAALGASRVPNSLIFKSVGSTVIMLAVIILAYDDIYGLISSAT
jgi:hypothetical protein